TFRLFCGRSLAPAVRLRCWARARERDGKQGCALVRSAMRRRDAAVNRNGDLWTAASGFAFLVALIVIASFSFAARDRDASVDWRNPTNLSAAVSKLLYNHGH